MTTPMGEAPVWLPASPVAGERARERPLDGARGTLGAAQPWERPATLPMRQGPAVLTLGRCAARVLL